MDPREWFDKTGDPVDTELHIWLSMEPIGTEGVGLMLILGFFKNNEKTLRIAEVPVSSIPGEITVEM